MTEPAPHQPAVPPTADGSVPGVPDPSGTAGGHPTAGVEASAADIDEAVSGDTGPAAAGERRAGSPPVE